MTIAQQGAFLTAEWKNLLMLNYAVDPDLLRAFVPAGTELDEFDGRTYVSLIGFEFNQTRMLGCAVPFHQAFEEVNLRFYVRRNEKRGVVFIRELVPKFAVAAIARLAYGERYSAVPMSHRIERSNGSTTGWSFPGDRGRESAESQRRRWGRSICRPRARFPSSLPSTTGVTPRSEANERWNTRLNTRSGR